MPEYVKVAQASELEPNHGKLVEVQGKKIALFTLDGKFHAIDNTCTHRGAIVCRRDEGNAKTFQCFYHAWTFDNRGALIGVPDVRIAAALSQRGNSRATRSLAPGMARGSKLAPARCSARQRRNGWVPTKSG